MKKYTLKESIKYWDRRSNQWMIDIAEGKHKFANEIKDVLNNIKFNSVLDYGSGSGQAKDLLFLNKDYEGYDISKRMISKAKKLNGDYFSLIDINNIKFKKDKYDLVFTHTVLEHIPNEFYKKVLKDLIKVGKVCLFVEPDIDKVKWGEFIHGFDRDYIKDLSQFGKVEKVEIKDTKADTNNSIYILRRGN